MSGIAGTLAQVRTRMAEACRRSSRDVSKVTLVAVSKKHPLSVIEEAYAAGHRDFGENYAQEMRDKAKALAHLKDLRWHAIGTLQSNKAKYVAPVASLFHALDDLEVAKELGKRAAAAGRTLPCLVEVHGGETTKSGVPFEDLDRFLRGAREVPALQIRGLMTMAPESADSDTSRTLFKKLHREAARLGLPELSMGMTQDFEVAIEEGATLIRVGTAIFGERLKPL